MAKRRLADHWLIPVVLAAAPLSCAGDDSDEDVGTATARVVSSSFTVATAPADPGFRLSVNWQCGVGLVAWAEPTAIGSHVVAVRFDADGNALDPTPFVILDVPNTTTTVGSVIVERAVDGFQVAINTSSMVFPVTSFGASAYAVGLDGVLGASFSLGGASASPPANASFGVGRGGFDGERSYFVTNSGYDVGASQPGMSFSVGLRAVGLGYIAGDNGVTGTFFKSASFRGFGCGEAGCLLLTTKPVNSFADEYEDVERMIVDGAVAASATQPASNPPVTGRGNVIGTGCGFLVVNPEESRVVGSTLTLLAGPQPLAGVSGAPYRAFHDGVDAQIYWGQSGLQSAALDSTGQPSPTVAEDPAFAGTSLALAAVGDGRAVQGFYEAGEIRVRFLGSNALVPVDGHCGGELDGDTGGAVCPSLIGATCGSSADCFSGFCVDGVCCDGACDGACQACTASAGASADGVCSPVTGSTCDDGDSCSQVDVCQAGACVGSDPVADGTVCEDDDECSQTSACQGGACVSATPMPDGTSCDDGVLCSTASACQGGLCVPSSFVICTPTNDCRETACVEASGLCEETSKPNGSPCSAACMVGSECLNGECLGDAVLCTPVDQCHGAGSCDAELSACTEPELLDGTTCITDNPCAQTAECQSGVCVDATFFECQPSGPCDAPFCEDGVGCIHAPKPDRAPCPGGTCIGGSCVDETEGGASAEGGGDGVGGAPGGAGGAAGGTGGNGADEPAPSDGGGCNGCVSAGSATHAPANLLLAALALMIGLRRRRSSAQNLAGDQGRLIR